MTRTVILWFRKDLRVHDNLALQRAVQWAKEQQQQPGVIAACDGKARILPIFCYNDAGTRGTQLSPSLIAQQFIDECVKDLASTLHAKYGVPLVISHQKPEDVIPLLAHRIGGEGLVVASTEVCTQEENITKRVVEQLPAEGWTFENVWNYSLYHPSDLPFNIQTELPFPFTQMRNKLEQRKPNPVAIRKPVPAPYTLPKPFGPDLLSWISATSLGEVYSPKQSDPCPPIIQLDRGLRFVGGETKALQRLEQFCKSGLSTYKSTRNESMGISFSSKLSPWLAHGCISPRTIRYRICQWELMNGGSTEHTYWITFELMVRDYMRFFAMRHGRKLFFELGPAQQLPNGVWWDNLDGSKPDVEKRFEAWKCGKTGVPWIDAHMRELVATGFMSNRGRQNVASFLIHNLNVDWRAGAAYFQKHLVDHDVTANWGNWVMAAGIASKYARVNKFNPVKQAYDFDPKANHARCWLDEFREFPKVVDIHAVGVRRPSSYPNPIVQLKHFDPKRRRQNVTFGKDPKQMMLSLVRKDGQAEITQWKLEQSG